MKSGQHLASLVLSTAKAQKKAVVLCQILESTSSVLQAHRKPESLTLPPFARTRWPTSTSRDLLSSKNMKTYSRTAVSPPKFKILRFGCLAVWPQVLFLSGVDL